MAELRVYYGDRSCVGRSPELAGETIGLKDIIRARNQRRRELRTTLAEREATVEALLRLRRGEEPHPEPLFPEPEPASVNRTATVTPEELLQRVTSAERPSQPTEFIVTKEYRRFAEFCDACREATLHRPVLRRAGCGQDGFGASVCTLGPAGVADGRATAYRASPVPPLDSGPWRTVLYTPGVTNTPRTVEQAVGNLWGTVDGLGSRRHVVQQSRLSRGAPTAPICSWSMKPTV